MAAQPQSSSTKPAPLSYADRARNHFKNQSSSSKPPPNGVSAHTLSPATSSGPSKPIAAVKVSPPNPKHPPSLSAPSMRRPSASSSSVRLTEAHSTLSVNGHPPTINGHPPSTSEANTPPHPPVNIWDLRKEQMAQGQATLRSSAIPPPAKDPPSSVGSLDRDHNTSSGLRDGNVSLHTVPPSNGASTVAPENDDPFVVKPRTSQPSNPVPPVEDKESWPEVGSAIAGNSSKERVEKPEKTLQDSSKKGKLPPRLVSYLLPSPCYSRQTKMDTCST